MFTLLFGIFLFTNLILSIFMIVLFKKYKEVKKKLSELNQISSIIGKIPKTYQEYVSFKRILRTNFPVLHCDKPPVDNLMPVNSIIVNHKTMEVNNG